MISLLIMLLLAVDDVRISIDPVNFQDEENPQTFVMGVRHLSTCGELLYVTPTDTPAVIVLDPDGNYLYSIGGSGQGPGKLGSFGPAGVLPLPNGSLWVQDSSRAKFLLYEQGLYSHQIKIPSQQQRSHNYAPHRFAGDHERLVIPAYAGRGKLAGAYDYGGNPIKYFGEIHKIDSSYYEINPTLNNTIWSRDEEYWFCVFMYWPIIRKFGNNFELVAEFHFVDGNLKELHQKFLNKEVNPNLHLPLPHITDFQIYNGHAYFLSAGTLYQVDIDSGNILEKGHFFVKPPFNERRGNPRLTFYSFAILNSGKVYLANMYGFEEQDFWVASVPFIAPKSE